jgi:hypothetical protein
VLDAQLEAEVVSPDRGGDIRLNAPQRPQVTDMLTAAAGAFVVPVVARLSDTRGSWRGRGLENDDERRGGHAARYAARAQPPGSARGDRLVGLPLLSLGRAWSSIRLGVLAQR